MNIEYYCNIIHKILLSQSNLLLDYTNIIIKIVTGGVAIIGLSYIRPLKEKTLSASFTFWSQLKVRLMRIKVRLEADNGILENMYAKVNRHSGEKLLPDISRVKELKCDIVDTINFIKKTPDQMPAYQGWGKDYFKLQLMLEECIVYDICDSEKHFKKISDGKNVIDNQKEMCDLISKICKGIDERQEELEKQIVKKPANKKSSEN